MSGAGSGEPAASGGGVRSAPLPAPCSPPPLKTTTMSRAPIAAPATPHGRPTCQPAAWAGEEVARAPHLWQNLAVAASAVPQLGQSLAGLNLTARLAAWSS